MLAFKALKKHSVIVYVNLKAKDRYEYISPIILTGLRKAQKQSSSYPYAVVSSVDQTKVFATLGGNVMASRKAYRNIAPSIKEGLQGTFPHIPKKGTAIQWPVKGMPATYTYYFGSVLDKNTLGIHRAKGIKQVTPFSASNQTVGIQRYIKTLGASFKVKADDAAEAGDKPATTPVSHEPTQWTNLKGKNITATFVSLAGDKLTLTLKNGKSATIPLSTLSKASQEKANNYATN